MNWLCDVFEQQTVEEHSRREMTNLAPFTEPELIPNSGDKAKAVMKQKEETGLLRQYV